MIHEVPGYPALCPQRLLRAYLDMTKSYKGTGLILSLPQRNIRFPIASATINSLTKKLLVSFGITGYGAHATRGAATAALSFLGVSPHIICALGDWKSYDAFMRHYYKVLSQQNVGLHLVRSAASVVGSTLGSLPASPDELTRSPCSASALGRSVGEQGEQAKDTMCPPFTSAPSPLPLLRQNRGVCHTFSPASAPSRVRFQVLESDSDSGEVSVSSGIPDRFDEDSGSDISGLAREKLDVRDAPGRGVVPRGVAPARFLHDLYDSFREPEKE
jgi:hypothetical protein